MLTTFSGVAATSLRIYTLWGAGKASKFLLCTAFLIAFGAFLGTFVFVMRDSGTAEVIADVD